MSDQLWLFNTMAKRRRSASDSFEENGLGVIESYLKARGYQVRVIDYATAATYQSLTPVGIARLTRMVYKRLIESKGRQSPGLALLKLMAGALQGLMSNIQERRMRKLLDSVAHEVAKNHVPLFGMKVWYGEAFTWAKYLTSRIKELSPETVVIAGGYHATLYEEDILRFSNFDLAVAGDGEDALHQMLKLVGAPWSKAVFLDAVHEKIRQGQISGGIFRDGEKIVRAERRQTNCEEIEHEKAIPVYRPDSGKAKVHILLESIGCPWGKCYFCVHNQFEKVYLKRNIDDLMNEIEMMNRQGVALFRFTGSDTPPDFGGKIAEAILKRGFKIEFTMGTRAVKGSSNPDIFNKIVNSYELLSKAGLKAVFMGGETGNDVINDKIMNKGLNREDIISTIKAIRAAEARTGLHVNVTLAMIYPTPLVDGITHEEVRRDNILLIRESAPDAVIATPPGPFKNSLWNSEKERFGFAMGESFVKTFMEYEYVLYKPLNMWPDFDLSLGGLSFKKILSLSQSFRAEVLNEIGIPSDLSDEHFLMMAAAGITGRQGVIDFRQNVMLDLVSCDYDYINAIGRKVSQKSAELARINTMQKSGAVSQAGT